MLAGLVAQCLLRKEKVNIPIEGKLDLSTANNLHRSEAKPLYRPQNFHQPTDLRSQVCPLSNRLDASG